MSEQEINRIIAENIVRFMEMKRLTQADVAAHCGVSQASVSNWCKGVKMPRMDKIDKLCELFSCSRSDLLDSYEPPEEPSLDDLLEKIFNDRPDMRGLFSLAWKATPEDVEKTMRILEALKGE